MYAIQKVDQLPMVPVDDPQVEAETFVPAVPFHRFALSSSFVVLSETVGHLASKFIGKAYKNKPDEGAALYESHMCGAHFWEFGCAEPRRSLAYTKSR
jgi:hypothetical protein